MTPIRSRVDHKPLPGVEVGDIGPKMGYAAVDNGYLAFDQYRVPRMALMAKFCEVSREGVFKLIGDPRQLY